MEGGDDLDKMKIFRQFMDTLYETSRLINTYESIPRKYGTEDELYMVEVHTLDLIGKHSTITMSEIAEITDRTKSAVSQMVDKLIKKDLALKYRNPNNYRELILELTSKGKVVYEHHDKLDEVEYSKHMRNLEQFTTEDFQTFIHIAGGVNRGVKRALLGQEVLEETKMEDESHD